MVPARSVTPPPLAGFRSVRGHGAAIDLLRRAVAHDRVASTYLFAGPQGVGKDRVAHALAQVMNCTQRRPPPDLDACGECRPCKLIATGHHPDVLILQRELKEPPENPEKADEKRRLRREEVPESELRPFIVIDDVRALINVMAFRPHEGGTRWVIVREAERLKTESANAFLKTLEEPPEFTHFVLLTHKPSMLLQTIRSRCQIVRFGPLEDAEVRAVLTDTGVEASVIEHVATYAEGSVGRALEFTDTEALARRKALVDELLGALRANHPGTFVTVGEKSKEAEKRDLDAALVLFQRHFRMEALQRAGTQPRHAAVYAARADIVRETLETLDGGGNLNVQLALEAMLVKLREARA